MCFWQLNDQCYLKYLIVQPVLLVTMITDVMLLVLVVGVVVVGV